MNNLSWFLYLADVSQGFLDFPLFIMGLVVFSLLSATIGLLIGGTFEEHREMIEYSNKFGRHLYWTIPVFFLMYLVTCAIPSRETFYLVAGSELGQQVVTSPEAKEIFDDIRTVIKQQIKEEVKP